MESHGEQAMESRVSFEKLTRESPVDVWQQRITSLLHTKDLGKWTQNVPVTTDDRVQSIKARAFVVLALSEEMVQLVSAVSFCKHDHESQPACECVADAVRGLHRKAAERREAEGVRLQSVRIFSVSLA